jgi:hypothetical protein
MQSSVSCKPLIPRRASRQVRHADAAFERVPGASARLFLPRGGAVHVAFSLPMSRKRLGSTQPFGTRNVIPGFSKFAFKCNLYRFLRRGGALQVEFS